MPMHIGETIAPLYPELSIQLFLADLTFTYIFFSTLFYTYLDLSRKYELVWYHIKEFGCAEENIGGGSIKVKKSHNS